MSPEERKEMRGRVDNLQAWKAYHADMPERDENGWYDLETGLRYDPEVDYRLGVTEEQAIRLAYGFD